MREEVTVGRSGATVHRVGQTYVKQSADRSIDLVGEGQRLAWLREQGIPAPEVLECEPGRLVMAEVPGRMASDAWPEEVKPRVVQAVARVARALHAVPVDDCPFDRRLDRVVAEALAADPDLDDLDAERQGWTRERLVGALLESRPAAEDLAVCHGDLCLPNIILDPTTLEVTGVIDTTRLGVADRWTDLALATRSFVSDQNPQFGAWAADGFLGAYGIEADHAKLGYYRLLDEFF